MPIALSKNETAPVWLKSDEDVPEAERPTFLFHHLTREEVRQIAAWRSEVPAASTVEQVEAVLDRIIGLALAGWRNMRSRDGEDIPYAPGAVNRVLTFAEKMELAVWYPQVVAEAEDAKKKRRFDSRSASATPESAPAAATEPAPTPPAPASP